MIVLAFALFGAGVGALQARRRRGNRLDIAQYAAGFAMAFAIVGVFVTVLLSRGL